MGPNMLKLYHICPERLTMFNFKPHDFAVRACGTEEARKTHGLHWTYVADVDCGDVDDGFMYTNTIDRPWTDNPQVRLVTPGVRLRSTSIGDIFVRNGEAIMCVAFGWVVLPRADFLTPVDPA